MKNDELFEKAKALKLYGLIAHWDEINDAEYLPKLLLWEEQERARRSLERRLSSARIEKFKSISEFDWDWPKTCDRQAIEELMQLGFIPEATNIILCGPNSVGKSMIACNISHHAVINGFSVLFTTASEMLNDLAAQDGDHALKRKLKFYARSDLLTIDEVGYLSYSNRHADLLFQIISRRYRKKPTMITTNKPFSEWGEIFPNASCVVSMIDRLIHHSEIINIDGESFRLKESKEKATLRKSSREKNKSNKDVVT